MLWLKMAFNSAGTPGRQNTLTPSPSSSSNKTPGALPTVFGRGMLPLGRYAILRLYFESSFSFEIPFLYFSSYFLKRIANTSSLSSNGLLVALATASNVISSKVGPKPPEVIIISGFLPITSKSAVEMSSSVSPTLIIRVIWAPTE